MEIFKTFTYDMLKDVPLYVVREIGRKIGVKSPTSKRKDVLIEEIIKIQRGVLTPVDISNRGAPPKFEVDLSEFLIKEEDKPYEEIPEDTAKFYLYDSEGQDTKIVEGVFEQMSSGYGFLRAKYYENSDKDVFVSTQLIKKYGLRKGDLVKGRANSKKEKEGTSVALQTVSEINGAELIRCLARRHFDDLTPCFPIERIKLESEFNQEDISIRCIDLFAPIGRGQRGLIVAPPKTGKTTLLKKIAKSIENNYPDITLMILLIDERPEEVTDIKHFVNAEVVSSTFDEAPDHHVKIAEVVLNRAKRLVEMDKHVVILLDSITRLARAYNNVIEPSGRTLSGGLDPAALQGPKRFFGAARNIENGGSLTILATALVDTGSKMDEVIFEEFKGTGNMEINLSRDLSEKRIFPAIDLYKSGTRKDELLLSDKEYDTALKLRKILSLRSDATDSLLEMLKKTKSNEDLTNKIDAWINLYNK